jgi:hypothetical protein
MGDGWNGDPIEIIPGTPDDVSTLRQNLINMVRNGGNMGASRYGHQTQIGEKGGIPLYRFDPYQINAGTDQQQTGGANILNRMAGMKPYKPVTNNLYPQQEWGTVNMGGFDEAVPGPGYGPSPGPNPEQPAPGPINPPPQAQNPHPNPGPQPTRPAGQGGQPGVEQALAMMNMLRRQKQFGA